MIRAKAAEVYQAALARKRATLAALERVAASLAPVKGRKSVVLVSEGFVHEPTLTEFRDVVRAARQANAAIYFLDGRGLVGGPVTADAELAEGDRSAGPQCRAEREPGRGAGRRFHRHRQRRLLHQELRNDLAAGLRRIAEESRRYYLLGYQPASTPVTASSARSRSRSSVRVSMCARGVAITPLTIVRGQARGRLARPERASGPRLSVSGGRRSRCA